MFDFFFVLFCVDLFISCYGWLYCRHAELYFCNFDYEWLFFSFYERRVVHFYAVSG